MSDIGWIELLVIVAVISVVILAPRNAPRLWRWLHKATHGSEMDGEGGEDEGGEDAGASDSDTDNGADTGEGTGEKGE